MITVDNSTPGKVVLTMDVTEESIQEFKPGKDKDGKPKPANVGWRGEARDVSVGSRVASMVQILIITKPEG